MKTDRLAKIGFTCVAVTGDRQITGGFCGDLLSWVMGRAKNGDCWFTVMANLNTIAVATLAEVSAIVFCHGATLPEEAVERAREEGIDVFCTELSVYDAAVKFHEFFTGAQ